MSPTQRTLKWFRDLGYTCQVVEKYNAFIHIRQDLFKCIDIVAIKGEENGVLGIQCTSSAHFQDRLQKIVKIPEIRIWLSANNRLILQTWRKNIKGRYVERQVEITLKDLVQ